MSLILAMCGCRTLDPAAESVKVLDRAPMACKELGVVNVDWTWWGASTESINAMRNQTASLGGNALLIHGNEVGTAYKCPNETKAQ